MSLNRQMGVKKEDHGFVKVEIHSRGLTKQGENFLKTFCFFNSGRAMQHSVIHELLVRCGRKIG